MKKRLNVLIFIMPLLIACSANINQAEFKSGYSEECNQSGYVENKISRIDVPNLIGASIIPENKELKLIENTEMINSPVISPIKDDKFVILYKYNKVSLIVGKIFDKNEKEVISRFKALDSKDISYFQLITDENSNYFYVFYAVNNKNNSYQEFFIKRFDLTGNQIGNEIKLEQIYSYDEFSKINFSFDQNGNSLILSWVTLKFKDVEKQGCFLLPCPVPAIPPNISFNPVVNIIKFDEKLNFCRIKAGFDEIINTGFHTSPNNDYTAPYINRNRSKVIYPISLGNIKSINLDNKTIKSSESSSLNPEYYDNYQLNIKEDNENNFYFITGNEIYKKNSEFIDIKSKKFSSDDYDKTSELDLKKLDETIMVDNYIFTDKDLNLFHYKNTSAFTDNTFNTIRFKNGLLLNRDNYFKVINKE